MSLLPADYPTDQNGAFALLATRKKLSVDDLKMLALLEAAGESAYAAMAAAIANSEAQALLNRNGQEERGHAHRLLKAIALLGGAFELPEDSQNPYVLPMQFDHLSSGFLDMIEQLEQDGDLQYQAWADAETNAEVAKIYRQNGIEETRHGERIAQVKALLL